ncbi:MAG: Asp/Glu/hydantoin racemase [Cyclobacteriaceae bacterium]
MKTVVAVHTAMPMVEPTKELFNKHLPDVRLINIVDDSLIQDVIREGLVSESVKKRLLGYYDSSIEAGADVIFNTCSSIGDVALEAKSKIEVPLVKIDDAMARKAVQESSNIAVMATLPTTLSPTVRLLQHFADALGKSVDLTEGLAEGAFEAVISGDREKHDQLILDAAKGLPEDVEVIVLAQGSMARMQDQIANQTGKIVFSSPEMGVLDVKKTLEN